MNDDFEMLIARKLTRPTDNVLFSVLVEVALAKGEWIERVEQLPDLLHAHLDCSFGILSSHLTNLVAQPYTFYR